jgi:hypothetical protein
MSAETPEEQQADIEDLRRRYEQLGKDVEQVLAQARGPRIPGWQVALRVGLALALYAGLIVAVYMVVNAWWGVLIGIALPFVALLAYAVGTHYYDQYQLGGRRTLGKLRVDVDGSSKTVRYDWSGEPQLLPAIALVQLENKIAYYAGMRPREELVTRAREIATARLAGTTAPPPWQAVAGNGTTDACELARARLGVTYSTYGSIGGSKPSFEDDVDACLALLHHGMKQPNGEDLARSVLELAQSPGESRRRRGKRFRRAIAPLVPE